MCKKKQGIWIVHAIALVFVTWDTTYIFNYYRYFIFIDKRINKYIYIYVHIYIERERYDETFIYILSVTKLEILVYWFVILQFVYWFCSGATSEFDRFTVFCLDRFVTSCSPFFVED